MERVPGMVGEALRPEAKCDVMEERLFIRADASPQIGTGHVMRCLALAQAWQDSGGSVSFVMVMEAPALENRLTSEGMEVVRLSADPGSVDDAHQTAGLVQEAGSDWVVVDGYHFGADYQRVIKDHALRLLFIDDNEHADHYCADVVLNQNIYAQDGWYASREPHTQPLLGTRYALLRQEFLKWRGWNRETPKVAGKVLVTLGGGDVEGVTLKVIRALQRVKVAELQATVVVGGSSRRGKELQSAIRGLRFAVRLERDVKSMPELIAWADLAVSAGGSTCWELAFMGLPACVLILAENQERNVSALGLRAQVVDLGRAADVSEERISGEIEGLMTDRRRRQGMSEQGRALVDGAGASRVVRAMREQCQYLSMKTR